MQNQPRNHAVLPRLGLSVAILNQSTPYGLRLPSSSTEYIEFNTSSFISAIQREEWLDSRDSFITYRLEFVEVLASSSQFSQPS
jgi:hypothetical protein